MSAGMRVENPNRVLFVTLIGMLATNYPFTILTVALKLIAEEFGVSEAVATWTVSVPMLVSAVTLPLMGKLGDMYGHRKMFLLGIGGSTLFAIGCYFAWDIWSLIAFRLLSMVLAGATTPAAMALLFHSFPVERRTNAISWWSMAGAGAPAIGLIIGGPVIDLIGWRSVFLVQILVGVVVFLASLRGLPETDRQKAKFDHLGNLVLIVALGFLLTAIGSIGDNSLPSAIVVAGAALGFIGLYLFQKIEQRASDPIMPPFFFRQRNFSVPAVASFCMQAAYLGALVVAPFMLMDQFGYAVTGAAAIMLIRTVSLTLASPIGGRFATRFGERVGAVTGCTIQGIGLAFLGLGAMTTSLEAVIVGFVLQGVGHGFALPPMTSVISTAVPDELFGTASGASRLIVQVGASFGLNLFAVLLALPGGSANMDAIFATGAVVSFIAAVTALGISMDHRDRDPDGKMAAVH